jgi:molybdate transport system substrate-binding protein
MSASRRAALAAIVVPLILLAGCGGDDADTAASTSSPSSSGSDISGKVVVLAASSLTESFTELGKVFEAKYPGTTVSFSFAASSELATQIEQGAPADVFASASPATMALVSDSGGTADQPVTFVSNTLEIAVPAGNPAKVTGLADFAKKDLTIALCAPEVPCGAAAEKVFAAAKVTPAPDTLESDVKATLSKVTLGEVDAALVYRTDVLAAGDKVEGIDFPEAAGAVNDYPIAVLADAPNPDGAQAFVDLVLSPEGAKVLGAAGFDLP